MKKVVLASLLAIAGAASTASYAFAQDQTPAASAGSVQMSPEEYNAYNNANTQASPALKAAAFENYLNAYPKSAVKADVLNQLLYIYSGLNNKEATLSTADKVLAIDPNNLRALTLEVYYGKPDADAMTDATAKQAALDKLAAYAKTGMSAPKPASMPDADYKTLKETSQRIFESVVADDDLAKKDNADAVTALKAEIDANEPMTEKASPVLQDVYVLAQAYYTSTPPDFLNCAWYAARAEVFAPEPYKTTIKGLATYCYSKYHGNKTGYEALEAMVQTTLDPPADLSTKVTPAPKPEDIVANLISTTPDLATLAISDKEFVLQYGKPADADKVFDTVKGKSTEFPGVTVVAATADSVQVAVSDDAVQSKTADFTFTMKEPIKDKDIPAVGAKVTIDGTYASYTQKPLMITMSDGALVLPKPVVHHAPVHHHK